MNQEELIEEIWRIIKDMRNSIIHQYWKVDLDIEWEIIEKEKSEE